MTSLEKFFAREIGERAFSAALLAGEIQNLSVNRAERSVKLSVRFPSFVPYKEIQQFVGAVQTASAGVALMKILPVFSQEDFSLPCIPSLLAALKEDDATLNGTFQQADSQYQDGKLSIQLAHGGYDLLTAHQTDRRLQELIEHGSIFPVR